MVVAVGSGFDGCEMASEPCVRPNRAGTSGRVASRGSGVSVGGKSVAVGSPRRENVEGLPDGSCSESVASMFRGGRLLHSALEESESEPPKQPASVLDRSTANKVIDVVIHNVLIISFALCDRQHLAHSAIRFEYY